MVSVRVFKVCQEIVPSSPNVDVGDRLLSGSDFAALTLN
jgi:hypothetical protein